jgi:hypothetical protein
MASVGILIDVEVADQVIRTGRVQNQSRFKACYISILEYFVLQAKVLKRLRNGALNTVRVGEFEAPFIIETPGIWTSLVTDLGSVADQWEFSIDFAPISREAACNVPALSERYSLNLRDSVNLATADANDFLFLASKRTLTHQLVAAIEDLGVRYELAQIDGHAWSGAGDQA